MSPSTLTLNDGTQAPWLVFGTGSAKLSREAAETAVTVAIQNGFTHLVGSQVHKNEEALGAGIAASGKSRSELYITTKLRKLARGETPMSLLQESLARLKVEYVDLYLIHAVREHEDIKNVWKGMEEAKAAGLTRSIGIANCTNDYLKNILEVATIVPAINHVEVHPYVWGTLQPHLALQKRHGIMTSSYGGLMPIDHAKGGPLDPVLEQIRVRLEKSRGSYVSNTQVLVKWLQRQGVLVVITSLDAKRIRECLDTVHVPELTQEELQFIENISVKTHYRFFSPNWPRCEKGTWYCADWIQGDEWISKNWFDV